MSIGEAAGKAARKIRTGMGMARPNMTRSNQTNTTAAPMAAGTAGQSSLHPAAQASRDMQAAGETRMDRDRQRRWTAYRSTTS